MAIQSVYYLNGADNTTIELSPEQLRSLLGQIEAQLHTSKVYRRALATVKKMFGDEAAPIQQLFKAVGREAIGLAFFELAQQQADTPTTPDASISPMTSPQPTQVNAIASAASESEVMSTDPITPVTTEADSTNRKKPSKAELAMRAATEQYLESLRQIGAQLYHARTSQSLTLEELRVQTFMPLHMMTALETGDWESLPEDVYIRGFIRRMGNALGLNGADLAAALPPVPVVTPTKTVLPTWEQTTKLSGGLSLHPVHLYVGYTALVAGAVGGLSFLSQHHAAGNAVNSDRVKNPRQSVSQSQQPQVEMAKPGVKSTKTGVVVGSDMAPPEAL